jgi:DNA-binding CsgD family transcriptional regulator
MGIPRGRSSGSPSPCSFHQKGSTNSTADELITAIRSVAAGGTYIDPRLAGELVEQVAGPSASAEADGPHGQLTTREAEVLRLIAWGQSNKEIAAKLGISVKTVEYHKASAAHKLSLRSRTDILRYALAQGWLHAGQEPTAEACGLVTQRVPAARMPSGPIQRKS